MKQEEKEQEVGAIVTEVAEPEAATVTAAGDAADAVRQVTPALERVAKERPAEAHRAVARGNEAEVASSGATDPRVDDLDRRIRELEAAIGDLRTVSAGAAAPAAGGRKTQVAYAPRLLGKGAEPARESGVDAALGSLSVEQRIAVKAGLLRAGLL